MTAGPIIIGIPDPEVKLILTYTNEDLEILGEFDIEEEIVISTKSEPVTVEAVTVKEYFGMLSNLNIFPVQNSSSMWGKVATPEEKVLGSLIYKIIEMYPSMDYILFPKVEVVKTSNPTGNPGTSLLYIRITGKAVRIKI